METEHAIYRCPGCGCAEGEPLNDECWPCQNDGELRGASFAPLQRCEPIDAAEPLAARHA